MHTGDWSGGHEDRDKYEYKPMEASLLNTFKLEDGSSYLKCDILQIAHHSINDWVGNFYAAVDPDVVFFPQQDINYDQLGHPCYKNVVNQMRNMGVLDRNMLFAGRYTYGITIGLDGKMTISYEEIAGADEIYYEGIAKYEPFHAPTSGEVVLS